jgi:hypothetical protein
MGRGNACHAAVNLAHMGDDSVVTFGAALFAMNANSATMIRMLGEGFI